MSPILIEIKQDRPGFDNFIGTWVCKGDINIIIDVGPANSVNRLIKSLIDMNLERVDFILLTHIHIDHSGGLADFLEHFPMAEVICHSKGIRHLVEPSKLWAGSRTALGEIAEFYGPLKPVQKERLIPHTDAGIDGLEIIETPGHAPHHLSFIYQGNLFVGEAGGNYSTVLEKEYLRPATPPMFFLGEFLKSIDLLLASEDQPICYAHFGKAESSHRLLHRFRNQLIQWKEIIKEEMSNGQRHIVERCVERLLEKDPDIKAFEAMEPEIRIRERFFLENSVRGYLGFLQNKE
ncbi:MAG: MBL fold metallo-hydrolase [Deltaproteobacteria bacterium]|nr:MBL fold metallo-hydrolase [Deltaproteobacteria bacterium]MBW1861289.1 MBL fold metallo-hydrolase [Deltaproteobacteria bacterium]